MNKRTALLVSIIGAAEIADNHKLAAIAARALENHPNVNNALERLNADIRNAGNARLDRISRFARQPTAA